MYSHSGSDFVWILHQVLHVYEGHSSTVTCLVPLGAHLVSIDCTGHVMVWDVHNEGKN